MAPELLPSSRADDEARSHRGAVKMSEMNRLGRALSYALGVAQSFNVCSRGKVAGIRSKREQIGAAFGDEREERA
jgi:hypothetical protein